MVSRSPPLYENQAWRRFTSTVIDDIWTDVLFFTLFATMVTVVSELTAHNLGISGLLVTFLGTVLGTLVSFRTISAYTSYQDGRKMWSNITVGSRNLAQLIWIYVPDMPKNDANMDEKEKNERVLQTVIEKKSMINLIQAFAISMKHSLRGEPGVFYEDLYPLISFLPRYANAIQQDEDILPLWASCSESGTHGPLPLKPQATRASGGNDPGIQATQRTGSNPSQEQISHPAASQSVVTLVAASGRPSTESSEPPAADEKPEQGVPANEPLSPIRDEKELPTPFGLEPPGSIPAKLHGKKVVDPAIGLPNVPCHRDLGPAHKPPSSTIYEYIPFFKLFRWAAQAVHKKDIARDAMEHRIKRKKLSAVDCNAPFEILMYLSSYISELIRDGVAQPAVTASLINNTALLQDTLSNLERIRNTPIPFAYQTHLRMSIWLYLLFLPFQIVSHFGWLTIPALTFVSFVYLGFLEIGTQIEHPFSYEWNDLDVDGFCLAICRDLYEITAFTKPQVASFINEWNHPFLPNDSRNAIDIKKAVDDRGRFRMDGATQGVPASGIPSIRRLFLFNWRFSQENMASKHVEV